MNSTLFRNLADSRYRRLLYFIGLNKLLKPVDSLSARLFSCRRYQKRLKSYPPIFIVGPPRSGTTLVYQYFSNVLDVSFISNLWSILPKSAPYIKKIVCAIPPEEFVSYYGNGPSLLSVQEGGHVFNQWFPDNENHYYSEIESKIEMNLKRYFQIVSDNSQKPWLIKNSRNAVRISVLSKVFEQAIYIRIRRSPLLIAKSILRGGYQLYGEQFTNWTVKPRNWREFESLSPPEQVAQQVFSIEKQIDQDLSEISMDKVITINYPDFCLNPFEMASKVCNKFECLHFRENIGDEIINKKFAVSLGGSENGDQYETLKESLKKLYGHSLNFS